MDCSKTRELIESYIMSDITDTDRVLVNEHISVCEECAEAHNQAKVFIGRLQGIKNNIKLKEDAFSMSKQYISKAVNEKSQNRGFYRRLFPGAAACIFLVLFLLTGSVVAFPSLAASYTPQLPIVKEMEETRKQNEEIRQQINQIKEENEQLKIELKKINDVVVKEVETGKGIPEEENYLIQSFVLGFIKAQYNGDLGVIKSMCTNEFAKSVDEMKDSILLKNSGKLMFSQITATVKEGDTYLVFVRLSDGLIKDGADYQENFEIVKSKGELKVKFVGMDA